MKNKKEFFGVLFSVLISVFLVFIGVYATTTVGNDVTIGDDLTVTGNGLNFGNLASISNAADAELLTLTEDLVSIVGKASVSGAFYVTGLATFAGAASVSSGDLSVETGDFSVGGISTLTGLATFAGGIDTAGSTTDITLKNDATIVNTSADLLTITEPTITLAGATKINLDGPVDLSGALVLDAAATTGIDITGTSAVVTGIDIGTTTTTGISFTGGSATLINASATAAGASSAGIVIGADAVQSGIPLHGATWDTGNALYCDDDAVALIDGGYIECLTTKLWIAGAVTGGASTDASVAAMHPDLYLGASYTGKGGLSAIWGNTTIAASTIADTRAGSGDVSGANFGVDINGTLSSSSFAAGVSAGGKIGNTTGSNLGIFTGFRIRQQTESGAWSGALSIPDAGSDNANGVLSADIGHTDNGTTRYLKVYVGTKPYTITMLALPY